MTTTDVSTYRFNHTMLRVKDPEASLAFYQDVLGMKLLIKSDMPAGKFTLYFLAYYDGPIPESDQEKWELATSLSGVLELTHNWGTESDSSFAGYHNGNKDPRGFGHIAVVVDDIEAACNRFEGMNVKFLKRLTDGTMKNIAFIADPDGYWIEILRKGNSQPPKH